MWHARRGCLGGLARLRARTYFSPFVRCQGTLSARGATVTPHGSSYCKSPNGRRVGSPAGQQPSSWEGGGVVFVVFSLLVCSPLWPRVSFHSGLSQQSPALWLLLAPSATPRCFPISEVRRVYIVDSFIVAPKRSLDITRFLLFWSHLQWQIKLSLSWRYKAVAWPLPLYLYTDSTSSRRANTARALAPDSEDISIQVSPAI